MDSSATLFPVGVQTGSCDLEAGGGGDDEEEDEDDGESVASLVFFNSADYSATESQSCRAGMMAEPP